MDDIEWLRKNLDDTENDNYLHHLAKELIPVLLDVLEHAGDYDPPRETWDYIRSAQRVIKEIRKREEP